MHLSTVGDAADDHGVTAVRQHVWAVALVALGAVAIGLFLTAWRPRYQPSTQKVPSVPLPYSHVQFSVSDVRSAFAAVGVRLVPKSRVPGVVTTVGTRHDEFEVDVFGDPARVNGLGGSPDITTDSHGNYVHIPSRCTAGIADAERWHANVRVVIRCANPAHAQLLSVGARALANL